MRTTEKPMKNQRRNNEKRWKTKDNFASILNYFRPVTFCPCFFEFSIFNGERNKRQFWKKKETCLEVSWRLSVHKTLQTCSKLHFFVHMCFKRGYFSVCCFLGTLMEENTPAGENLACHFIPKICILYGNTVVRGLAHWNLECSQAGILKYPKKRGFWRLPKFKLQNFGKLGSILSFSVSLHNKLMHK